MTKTELVAAIAERSDLSKHDAERALNAFQEIVMETVGRGSEKLTIPGFLAFERTDRAARTGRNPRTGEPIHVPATKAVRITAGAKLKAAAKGGA